MRNALALWFVAVALPASPESFAGRWAMQSTDPARRVFWMDVTSVSPAAGNFFGATGGRLERFRDASLEGNQLRFRVERPMPGTPPRTLSADVRLHLRNGSLQGTVATPDRTYRVTGWPSPRIADRDDGRWRAVQTVDLLKDGLPGWHTERPGRMADWRLEGGILSNRIARADLLVSNESYWNFRLDAEYLLPKNGNAGIGLRHHYELQLADDHGQAPDVHGNASLYSQIKPVVNASRPAGEWQSIAVTLIGRDLSVTLNGQLVIDRQPIRGLTGLALNPNEEQPGPVSLQGDHGQVMYRNVRITPLERR